jgi:hypothetical protein
MSTNKSDIPFRILSVFMLLPLGASIAVQYNDPDGFVWMLIYGYSIVVTIPAIFGIYSPWAVPGLLGYLAGFVYLVPSFEPPYLKSELTREGGGMFIAAAWMFCLVLAWYLKERPTEEPIPSVAADGGGCGSGSCGCGKQAG